MPCSCALSYHILCDMFSRVVCCLLCLHAGSLVEMSVALRSHMLSQVTLLEEKWLKKAFSHTECSAGILPTSMTSGSGERVLWCKIGANQPTQIRVRGDANIDDLKKSIKEAVQPLFDQVSIINITIKTSIAGEALALPPDQSINSIRNTSALDPLYIHYEQPAEPQVFVWAQKSGKKVLFQ